MDKKRNKILKPLLIVAAVAIFLVVYVAVFINAGRPSAACLMCHNMRDSYQTWRESTHSSVKCNKCHYAAPSGFTMIASTVTGKAARKDYTAVSAGCKTCHKKLKNVVSIENITFPHDNHQDVQDCETCHLNVVHGKGVDYSFQKSSKMCYDCHEHSEVNPHSDDWQKAHGKNVKESSKECQACHSYKYCANCHTVLEQHKTEWYDSHRRIARESEQICKSCHDDKFCSSCHDGFTLHKRDWLKNHKDDPDSKNQQKCASCHTKTYCASCHQDNKHVLHHKGNWLSNHGGEINEHQGAPAGDLEQCVDCHQPDFCLSCHRGLNKRIHSTSYQQMHINVKRESLPGCLKCHTQDSCDQCHNTNLPTSHVQKEEWLKTHGNESIRKMDSCTLCHSQQFCAACHSRKLPISHETTKWGSTHGKDSRSKDSNCSMCHEEKYCNACHRRSRPPDHYKLTWRDNHSHTAIFDMSGCFACHVNSDCRKCHNNEGKTHKAAGWMLNHTSSDANFKTCEQCHSTNSCTECHTEMKLSGHKDCSSCHKVPKKFSNVDGAICATCHKEQPGNLHEQHNPLGCDSCHEPHKWVSGDHSCTNCHSDKDEEHSSGMPCLDCHDFK